MRLHRTHVLLLVVWLLCFTAAAGLTVRSQQSERQALFDRFANRSDTGASFIGAYVGGVFQAEERLAQRMAEDSWSPSEFATSARFLGFPQSVLLDPQGRVVAAGPDAPELRGTQLADRYPHLATALDGRRAVSDVIESAVLKTPIVAFALPLGDNRFGVLSGGFNLSDGPLNTFLERQPIAGTRGYLLDSQGTAIVSAGPGATTVTGAQLASALERPTSADGRLMSASAIPGTKWSYVLDAPIATVLAPVAGNDRGQWVQLGAVAAVTLAGLLMLMRATLARTQARLEKAQSDDRLRMTVQSAPIGMTMLALDHRFVEPNARLCAMLAHSVTELSALTIEDVTHPDDVELDGVWVDQLVAGEIDNYELEKRYLRSDETLLWGRLAVSVVRAGDGKPLYFVAQIEDVTDFRAAQAELEHRALYDPLTGLANRGLLMDRLTHTLAQSRYPVNVGVGFCDVDHFKQINDTHGHHAGDKVLQEVASRLRSAVRGNDTVGRMGGDEFILLLTDVASLSEAEQAIERAMQAVQQPIQVDGKIFMVSLSVGLALGRPGSSPDTLLGDADLALYAAKGAGRGRCAVYDPALRSTTSGRATHPASPGSLVAAGGLARPGPSRMEHLIRAALDDDTVGVAYQPVFDLQSQRLVGVEALLRLTDSQGCVVAPRYVIPAAEASGLIVDLGRRVLHTAARQAASWQRHHGVLIPVAVNVSAAQLGLAGFPEDVLDAVRDAQVPPQALMLELTESVLLQSGSAGMDQLRDLRQSGIELAIDDFGTGYASLSLLHELPAATLKIDQSFVAGIPHDPRAVAIVAAVIALAENFDMTCIAEGIETESQRSYLAGLGVLGQGYLLGIPDDGAAIGRLIDAGAALEAPPALVGPPAEEVGAVPGAEHDTGYETGPGSAGVVSDRGYSKAAPWRDLSSFDAITGAYAREPGLTQLHREIARARRGPASLVVALVTVDCLDGSGETPAGPVEGRLLRDVATALKLEVRPYDLVVRYTRNQFVCAVPSVPFADWQRRLTAVQDEIVERLAQVSIRMGLAEMRPDDSAHTLIARADAAQREVEVTT